MVTPLSPALSAKRSGAMDIVRVHTALCIGMNLIPVPLLGSIAVSAVQMKMVAELARYYGIDFEGERRNALIVSIGSGLSHEAIAHGGFAHTIGVLLAKVPPLGGALRHLAFPSLFAALTYFLGKSYIDHFEAGGRLSDFKLPGFLHSPIVHAPL